MNIRGEIPVRSFAISAYLVRVEGGRGRYLLLKRLSMYLKGSWQQVSGRIEQGGNRNFVRSSPPDFLRIPTG